MNNIYLTCDMNVRATPSLDAQITEIQREGNILPVIEMTEDSKGLVWFHIPSGYIANTTSVFLHAERYDADNTRLKEFITAFLDSSYIATGKAIAEIKKGLDQF